MLLTPRCLRFLFDKCPPHSLSLAWWSLSGHGCDSERLHYFFLTQARAAESMTEQEWVELLLLEAPSILGVCHPAAAALDVSEPSFCWESSESEASASDVCMDASPLGDSLRGYSPSPCRVNSEAEGFNLAVNSAAIPESLPHFSEAENFAVDLLKKGWATEANLLRLMEMLPVSLRPFQVGDGSSEVDGSGIFCTGAYVYSSSVGLMLHARQFRAVTQLLTSLVNSLNPEHCYSSISLILNTASAPHRDSHNHPHSVNMVVPLSRFGQASFVRRWRRFGQWRSGPAPRDRTAVRHLQP